MTETTVVVTGATSGIGLALAGQLARRGVRLIGVGRSAARAAEAEASIRHGQPRSAPEYLAADLGSQRQVRALAAEILERAPVIDVLINNAAEVPHWYQATEDGYERQFAVNHLAAFLLTHELAPGLRAAPGARVVTVSSGSHRGARIEWADVMLRRRYSPLRAYRQSKLANVLFTYELNRRRAAGPRVIAFAADPGLVNTAIGSKGRSRLMGRVWAWRRRGGVLPESAAAGIAFLALEAIPRPAESAYWKEGRPIRPSREAESPDEAKRLWELSERLCGLPLAAEGPAAGPIETDLALRGKMA